MLNSENPFIRQFPSGESQGPLTMDKTRSRAGDSQGEALLQTDGSRRWASAAAVAVGVSAATALVATAARAPLSRSTPVNAAAAGAPLTALFMLFVAAAVATLAAFGTLRWTSPRRKNDEPEPKPEPLQTHWIWKLLAVLAPLALGAALVAAAVIGIRTPHQAPRLRGGSFDQPLPAPAGQKVGGSGFVLPSWLPWTVLAIVAVALASAAVLLTLGRARPADERSETSAARAAVEAAIEALGTITDPRSAVIAAYASMERTLAAHGVARLPAEAPREYLRRVLVETDGTARDAGTLTGLFEEARFSTHPVPERVRELALAALSSVRARLHTGGSG